MNEHAISSMEVPSSLRAVKFPAAHVFHIVGRWHAVWSCRDHQMVAVVWSICPIVTASNINFAIHKTLEDLPRAHVHVIHLVTVNVNAHREMDQKRA